MQPCLPRSGSLCLSAAGFFAFAALLSGCTPSQPAGWRANDAGRIAGIDGPIRFDVTGGETDVQGLGPAADGELTLIEAVRLALTTDPKVQQAIARVRAAEAEAGQARLLPNPMLDIVVRWPEGGGNPIINPRITVELMQLLLRPRHVSAADNKLRAATADALASVLDSLAQVQEKYFAVQALDAQIAVLRERRTLFERLLTLRRAEVRAGEAAGADVLALDGRRLALDTEVADRELDRITERLALARMIGRPSGSTDWRVTSWQPAEPVRGAESAWIEAALIHRPEVQARRWELASLGDELAVASLAPFSLLEVGSESERDVTWTVGPAIVTPIPLFDWGQGARAKAQAQQIEARHKLTETRRQVIEDVRRSYQTFSAARANLERMRSELIPLQQRRVQQAEASYRAGESSLLLLLEAEQDLQDAREKQVDLQRKLSSALVELHHSAGGPEVARTVEADAPTTRPGTTAPATRAGGRVASDAIGGAKTVAVWEKQPNYFDGF